MTPLTMFVATASAIVAWDLLTAGLILWLGPSDDQADVVGERGMWLALFRGILLGCLAAGAAVAADLA